MTYKDNLKEFVNLVNKVSKNEEDYQNKYNSVQNETNSYNYRYDPEYQKGVKENEEYYNKKAYGDRYSHLMYTEGMNNSYADSMKSIYTKKMNESNAALAKRLKQISDDEFEERRARRLSNLVKKYKSSRYNDMYTLGKANEEYLGVGG